VKDVEFVGFSTSTPK